MSDVPFGFGPGNGGSSGPGGSGSNPFGGLPDDLAGKIPLFAELQKLFSSSGPVNWDLARQIAISTLTEGHTQVSSADRAAVEEAVRLADLWLDDVTEFPSGITSTKSWTRVEWVEQTLPVWATLCDPIAAHVATAMTTGLPEEIRAQAGPMAPIMNQLGGMMFGSQVGQAIGGLANEILSATDIGLPLGPAGTAALVPANVAAFSTGLGRPENEVRLYLALREAAHHRLFAHVPWLRQRLIDTVDAYSRGISIDSTSIERMMSEIDPTNPESLQNALTSGMFEPQETPEQQAALRRLETLLALVEGWVDAVVAEVSTNRLGGAEALREASRRRRASGGPAEQTFATLVGLELRPRKLREASALWAAAAHKLGRDGRDALWEHPDLLPDSNDLDDPDGFLARKTGVTDDALAELFDSEDRKNAVAAETSIGPADQSDTGQHSTGQNSTPESTGPTDAPSDSDEAPPEAP
ncbi:MAG: uncharacterized protein JWM76_1582 [Pseudonocardiales bacterium]|nr:uncharacterized protein [Pseudonocardiales bacterium]